MKKLYLHIGGHRTGSSSIQVYLNDHRNELLDVGILYPKAGVIEVAHHELCFSFMEQKPQGYDDLVIRDSAELLGQLALEIERSRADRTVISSEVFISYKSNEIARLKTLFDLFDEVEMIVYLRDQVGLMESSYRFNVMWDQSREGGSFESYIAEGLASDYHEYDLRLGAWNAVHPSLRVTVKDFGVESVAGLVKGFINTIGHDCEVVYAPRENASLFRVSVLLLRYANRGQWDTAVRDKLISFLQKFQRSDLRARRARLYDPDSLGRVRERFRDSNLRVKREYGIDLDAPIRRLSTADLLGEHLIDSDWDLLLKYLADHVDRVL